MTKRLLPALLVLASLVACGAVGGCGGATVRVHGHDGRTTTRRVYGSAEAAARRASNEIPCALESIGVRDIGSGGYQVDGCGVRITYTCVGGFCSPDERTAAIGSRDPETRGTGRAHDTWSDDQVRSLLAMLRAPIVACLPEGTDSIRLQVGLSARGQVQRVGQARFPDEVATCIDRTLVRARLPGRVGSSRSVVLQIRRGDASAGQPVESVTTPQGEPPPPAGTMTAEAAARAAIDTRAAAILECVQAEALSMQVSWSSAGRLDALLRGERQGTPDEGCVRAIVQQLAIPAPGATGTIVHAIQRAP